MTLQTSGPISMSDISAEFGFGNKLSDYWGVLWWTNSGSRGYFSTGTISLSDFYGKRATNPGAGGGGGGIEA